MERSGRFVKAGRVAVGLVAAASWAAGSFAGVEEWSRRAPYGASIKNIVLDPSAPSHLVVSVRPHGHFYSHDGAASWTPVEPALSGTAADLVAAAGVVYASTYGEGLLLWRSYDGGVTWSAVPNDRERLFRLLAVDPADPLTLYGAYEGIFRSRDGGETWTAIENGLDGHVVALAFEIDPTDPARLFLAASEGTGVSHGWGIFHSRDGGDSWEAADQGLPHDPANPPGFLPRSLAIDPAATSTLFAVLETSGLHRSDDSGATWVAVPAPVPGLVCVRDGLKVVGGEPSTLYLSACGGLMRSRDSGATWDLADPTPFESTLDLVDYVIDPITPTTLYSGSWVQLLGARRSDDGGDTWTPRNHGFPGIPLLRTVFDGAGRLWAIPDCQGSFFCSMVIFSPDGGSTWEISRSFVGDLADLAVDAEGAAYAAVRGNRDGGLYRYRTAELGQSWQRVDFDPDSRFPSSVDADPGERRYVYATAADQADGVLRSDDGGLHFVRLDADFGGSLARFVKVDPATGDVYAALGDGRVMRSRDRGASWSDLAGPLPSTVPGAITVADDIAFDPWSERIYVIPNFELWQLDPGDVTWQRTPITPFQFPRSLAFDPYDPAVIYMASQLGVLVSTNRGESFRPFHIDSMGRPRVDSLVFDPVRTHRLVAASEEGLFDIVLPPARETLALAGGRFEVEASWLDFQGRRGAGTVAVVPGSIEAAAALASRDSAVLEFFSGENWELLLKVLDGSSINGHFWVFFAAATNVEFRVTVTDTSCNQAKTYVNPLGLAAPAVTDVMAFVPCADPEPPSCIADGDTLCVGGGRFAVDVAWTNFSGAAGTGRQVVIPEPGYAASDDSGLFYFFSRDNWELLVKVLDGCSINNHFWFFSAATTDVSYSITVTDTETGATRTYSNPLGRSAAATTDTQAFTTCN